MSIDREFIERLKQLDARLRSLERIELPVAGSGGFAPSNAQYLTLATSTGLSNERVFTPVLPLSGLDGGAGAAYTLSIVSAALTRVNDTNVTLTLGGTPASALLAATSITVGWSGLLGLARGGTNADLSATGGAGQYLKQSSAGGAVSVGTIPASEIVSGAALTSADDTNVTLTLGGNPASALLAATSLTLGWTGTLSTARGGTGSGSLAAAGIVTGTGAANELVFWSGTNTVSSSPRLTRGASGDLLTITPGATTDTALKIQMIASQSASQIVLLDSNTAERFTVSQLGIITSTRYAANSGITMRRSNGTGAAPTKVLSGEVTGVLTWVGYAESASPGFVNLAQFRNYADQDIATNARNNSIIITFFDNAGASQDRFSFDSNRNFGIRTTAATFGSVTDCISAANATTAPTAGLADRYVIYSADYAAGDAGMFVMPEVTGPTIHKFASLYELDKTDAVTNAVTTMQIWNHKSSGTAAAGFGISNVWKLQSSTTASQTAASIDVSWNTATHASRKADIIFYAWDTAAREFMRGQGNGSAAAIGFFGVTPVVRPTALTTKLTSITHTSPGTPDYAIQNLTNSSGYGFVTQDEGNTVLSVILNLQTRVNELETKLTALGLLT